MLRLNLKTCLTSFVFMSILISLVIGEDGNVFLPSRELSLGHVEQLLFSCVILAFRGMTVENLFR